jgi:hypothetical protein
VRAVPDGAALPLNMDITPKVLLVSMCDAVILPVRSELSYENPRSLKGAGRLAVGNRTRTPSDLVVPRIVAYETRLGVGVRHKHAAIHWTLCRALPAASAGSTR